MFRSRRITNPLGEILLLEVDDRDRAQLRMKRGDSHQPDIVMLSRRAASILKAFTMAARRSAALSDEQIEDEEGKTLLSLASTPAPRIIICQEDRVVEITAPFWDDLYCELGLFIPNMDEAVPLRPLMVH